jgi:hypothetical protein
MKFASPDEEEPVEKRWLVSGNSQVKFQSVGQISMALVSAMKKKALENKVGMAIVNSLKKTAIKVHAPIRALQDIIGKPSPHKDLLAFVLELVMQEWPRDVL